MIKHDISLKISRLEISVENDEILVHIKIKLFSDIKNDLFVKLFFPTEQDFAQNDCTMVNYCFIYLFSL